MRDKQEQEQGQGQGQGQEDLKNMLKNTCSSRTKNTPQEAQNQLNNKSEHRSIIRARNLTASSDVMPDDPLFRIHVIHVRICIKKCKYF
jgi:hypothetical protein